MPGFNTTIPLRLHLFQVTGIQHNLWWGAWILHPLSTWCWNNFTFHQISPCTPKQQTAWVLQPVTHETRNELHKGSHLTLYQLSFWHYFQYTENETHEFLHLILQQLNLFAEISIMLKHSKVRTRHMEFYTWTFSSSVSWEYRGPFKPQISSQAANKQAINRFSFKPQTNEPQICN